ncbi:MAG TPA: carboxypeptidase-like regulatory domain-containing protein, partial [Alphaproteobacteria bacterium]|nr:carboxypeptidase-like regulatory domain-containing protein [Alphaproteobacteria bacterium]
DIPILYGNSLFRIVLYGPQGQVEERTERVSVGNSMLRQGALEYNISANQKSLGLFNLDTEQSSPDNGAARLLGYVRYGIDDNLTAGGALSRTELEDGTSHTYAAFNAQTSLWGFSGEGDFVKDMSGGWAAGATALTEIEDISLRLRHRIFDHFVSETEAATTSTQRMESIADADTQVFLPVIEDINVGLQATRETYNDKKPETIFSNRLSKSFWGMSLSNTLDYTRNDESTLGGSFTWQSRLMNIALRASGHYQLQPERTIDGATLVAQYRLEDNITAQTQFDQQFGQTGTSHLGQSVSVDFEECRLSLQMDADDHALVSGGVHISFALAHDSINNRWRMQSNSMASGGAIAARVFLDENYNGIYDHGEKLVPDAALRLDKIPRKAENGEYFITSVAPYQPVMVDVDATSIKDPLLSPASDGFRVVTRPGDVVTLDFPLVSTSEIDGTVMLQDEAGNKYYVPDIVVELRNAKTQKVERSVISESDGFFYINKVRPGNYTVTIPAEALKEYQAEIETPMALTVSKTSDFYSGKRLLLRSAGGLSTKLIPIKKLEQDEPEAAPKTDEKTAAPALPPVAPAPPAKKPAQKSASAK